MNTFPYDSWEEALADADGTTGYFTWGTGGNTAIVIITILGIALALYWLIWLTVNEDRHLNDCADRVKDKWGL
ncbi:MAG: hypothetical protein ACR2PK_04130 [Acidimicrobiales bacterium]